MAFGRGKAKKATRPYFHLSLLFILLLSLFLTACSLDRKSADTTRWLILATSQEVADSGLLEAVVPKFEQTSGVKVKRLTVTTEQALRYARDGGVDVLLLNGGTQLDELAGSPPVLPPYSENPLPTPTLPPVPTATPTPQAVNFLLSERTLIFWSQIILVGSINDPCALVNSSTALKAMQRIITPNSGCKVMVAGKEPGLRSVEENLWELVGSFKVEERGANYQIFNGDALATLREAEKLGAYAVVPLSIFLTYANPAKMKIIYDRDAAFYTPYEAAIPNITRFRDRDLPLARSFVSYLTGTEVQNIIADTGKAKFNRPIFRPKGFLVYVP
jgi:tungstate transport system substrate-binding protein